MFISPTMMPRKPRRVEVREEEAVKIFDLVVKENMLPARLEDLVPLSIAGPVYIGFMKGKAKALKQLADNALARGDKEAWKMLEDQRKATLHDGQDTGEVILNIEARIGELYEALPSEAGVRPRNGQARGKQAGIKEAGIEHNRASKAVQVHRNPSAVAAVIKEARENEDIPTKTAVLNKIKGDKAQEQLKAFREKHDKEPSPVLAEYLEKSIEHLIQVNSVVKQFFAYPDQVDAKRMKELVRQVKILVDIISSKTGRESWKQLA